MNFPLHYHQKKYPIYEAIGWLVTVLLLAIALMSKSVIWDWFLDTLYFAAGAFLVYVQWWQKPEQQTEQKAQFFLSATMQLIVCLYLFVDSVLLFFMALPYFGFLLFVYLVLSVLYGAALVLRLKEEKTPIHFNEYKKLFQPPALLTTVSICILLICMYLPMRQYYQADYVTMPWILPSAMYKGWSTYNETRINLGNTLISIKGFQAIFGHLACLLVSALAIVHILNTEKITFSRSASFMKIAAVLLVFWWLFAVKGYQYFGNLANILFAAGCILLLAELFKTSKTKMLP